jgi:hypothetical protein
MIDLRVHKSLRIIWASELRLQVDFGNGTWSQAASEMASIKIRLGEWERIPDQFNPWFRVIEDDHFHDVKAEKNVGVVEHSQPGQRAARNSFLLFSIDSGNRPSKILPRACLHFDEHQRVVVATDNIDLTAAAPSEIAQ